MNNNDLVARIETLESRLMHQEATIDELTRTLLEQEQQLILQKKAIEMLERQVRSINTDSIVPPGEEPPPPHY